MKNKIKISSIALIFLIVGAGITIFFQVLAWNNPTAVPPNGDSALYYDSSTGNFGIGTAGPTYPFDVRYGFSKTDTAWRNVLRLGSNDALNPATLQFSMLGAATQSSRKAIIQVAEEGIANAGDLGLQPNGGNVGIGTATPNAKFEVNKGDGSAVRIGHTNSVGWPTSLLSVYNMDQGNGVNIVDFGTNLGGSFKIENTGIVVFDTVTALGWRSDPGIPPAGRVYIWYDGTNGDIRARFSSGVVRTIASP